MLFINVLKNLRTSAESILVYIELLKCYKYFNFIVKYHTVSDLGYVNLMVKKRKTLMCI